MKATDYAPRAGGMDAHLQGTDLVGVEVGCDAGAHAEALLRYCSIKQLVLIDLWDKDFFRGYCMGRIQSQGWKQHVEFVQKSSRQAASDYPNGMFDFVYIDITHDSEAVASSLDDWWPKLKPAGMLGYRNYSIPSIKPVLDEFALRNDIRTIEEKFHNELILFKDSQ